MSKIDTKGWREFKIWDFFDILKNETKLTNKDLSDEWTVPVYSSLTDNNWLFWYTDKSPSYKVSDEEPFFVVFGDHTKSMHIANWNFCVMDNVKVLKPHIYDVNIVRFILTVWSASIPNLGYSRHWSIAKDSEFLLPVDKDWNPDRVYMENYMKSLEEKCKTKLQNLILARGG